MQAVGFGVRSTTNEAAVTEWIIEGQFDHPVRVIAFNSGEGWSRDVTEDVARKLLDISRQGRVLGSAECEFVERATGETATAVVWWLAPVVAGYGTFLQCVKTMLSSPPITE